ncbi:MAG TPA: S-layer homology domain-containing protein [Mesotoga sp.]|nr:S-layer homology domain-containing protein [Mesotoga sp.]MDI9376020.1 S-layer homology domain-containing protein [Thermotogota bacterium]MDD4039432.1 S-layer homology domain-containing protein [Mesotoga sp.]MDD4478533.1 S-layer homology domain-containing protein [Mesotoga sp.]MDD5743327.1 S-layer homology domain-containing protein [Mesotoga sp.]
MKKSLLLASLLIFGLVVSSVAAPVNYVDVAQNHWAYNAVINLTNLGILNGVQGADGKLYFNGNDPLTRYQTAVMLQRTIDYVELNFARQGTIPQSSVSDAGLRSRLEALELSLTDASGKLIDTLDLQLRLTALENRVNSVGVGTTGTTVTQSTIDSLRNQIMKFVEDLSLTTKKIDTLALDVQNMQNSMANLSVMDAKVNDAVRRVDTLSSSLSAIQMSFSTHDRAISNLETSVQTISTEVNEFDAKISTLTNRASTNAMEIASIKDTINTMSGNTSSIRDLQNAINSLETQIANIKLPADATKKLDDLSARVNTIASEYVKVGDTQNFVTKTDLKANLNLYAGIDELAKVKEDSASLANSLAALRGDFNSETGIIKSDIGNLQRSLNAVNEIVAVHENDLSSLKNSLSLVTSLRTDLTALNSKFNALTDQQAMNLSATQANIADLEKRMNEAHNLLKVSIDASLSKIALSMDTVNTQLGKNENDIKTLKTRTDTLESRLNATVTNLDRYLKTSDLETQPVITNLSDRVAEINKTTVDAASKSDVETLQKKLQPWLIFSVISGLAGLGVAIYVLIAGPIS